MVKLVSYCIGFVLASGALTRVFAHSYGPPPRVTAGPGDSARACTSCHNGALNSGTGSVKIVLASGPVYIPGVKQRVIVEVADSTQQRWGFELSARLNSDPESSQAGDFHPIDNFTQVICEDAAPKPCSSGPSFIQHTSAGTRSGTPGGASFQFDWNPPATDAGPVTFYVAGNAANGDGNSTGDRIYTSSVQLRPAIPAVPRVTAGNIVSAATSAAGPLAADSWVTIYGSNLGVTTRSWSDIDFTNGGLPFSLDGVSVLVSVFGAPRLAYVGYVSPTQVNFLLPTDTLPGNVQVLVRNPAGMSAPVPTSIQANALQLLTADGKHVAGAHSNGASLDKAAPGESVVFYGTGCGPANPALINGQIPTQAATLARTPQVTIGCAGATVLSARTLPGSAGVCQINVQVPADAVVGDQAVVVQVGAFSSAPALLSVQR